MSPKVDLWVCRVALAVMGGLLAFIVAGVIAMLATQQWKFAAMLGFLILPVSAYYTGLAYEELKAAKGSQTL